MSNAELIRPQPQTSSLPTIVATAISLGIHGLIWGIQPILPLFSTPSPNSQRTVGLVELTPAELSRLPEYSLPPAPPPLPTAPPPTNVLPTLPATPPSTLLPPLPNLPYTPQPNPSPSNQAPRRTTPPTQPTPQTQPRTTPRRNPTPSQRELLLEESRSRRSGETSPLLIDKNESQLNIPKDESPFTDEFLRRQSQSQAPTTQAQPKPPVQPSQSPSKTPTEPAQNLSQPPVQPSPPVLPTGPATSRELLPEVKVGQARQPLQTETNQTPTQERTTLPTLPPNSTPTPLLSPTPNPAVASAIKLGYGYNPAGTTPGEASKSFQTWLEEKIKQFADQLNSARKPIRQKVKSPIKEQLPDVSEAGIAVLVDPEGKIVGEPKLIRSTGYPRLNQAAVENVQTLSFNPTGKYEIYQYQIEIEQQNLPATNAESSSNS